MLARTAGTVGLVGLLLFVGTGYAALAPNGNAYGHDKALDLVIASIAIESGPAYITLTSSSLPATNAWADVGLFRPGDTVTLVVTIRNVGSHPAQHLIRALDVQTPADACAAGSGASVVSTTPENLPIGAAFSSRVEMWAGPQANECGGTPFLDLTLTVSGQFPH